MSWQSYQDIAKHPKVAWSVPLSLGDSHRGFRVLGTSRDYFERYQYARDRRLVLTEGAPFSDLYGAVLGAEVAADLGYRIGDAIVLAHGASDVSFARHEDKPFRVSGILARTGTPVDRTLHVSLEAIEAIHSDWHSGTPAHHPAVLPLDKGQESGGVTELEWDALIPEGWQPDEIMARYDASGLEDEDPRAQALMDDLHALWKESPVVEDLDGKRVKLPGFVVPLDTDGRKMGEFLLVPYYGACIHVPPPPANQTVYVRTKKGQEYPGGLFDTLWVTGILKVESTSSDLAEAGYRLEATRIDPYE